MRQCAQHPADRVAQLAVGFLHVLENFRPDALVICIIDRRDPQAQDVGPRLLDDLLRGHHVAERFRHLRALLVHGEAMGEHHIEGRTASGAAAFDQTRVKPAPVLVRAFQIHDRVASAIDLAPGARQRREMPGIIQHVGMGRA